MLIRSFFFSVLCLAAVGVTSLATAQDTGFAPALFDVKEIIVKAPRLGSSAASRECGLQTETIADTLADQLRGYGLNAQVPLTASMPNASVARVMLQPEIVTLHHKDSLSCTSWVSLMVEGRSTLTIPPVRTPRTVTVTYWRTGALLNSTEQSHDDAVRNTLGKQIRKFAADYKLDQPPPLPELGQ